MMLDLSGFRDGSIVIDSDLPESSIIDRVAMC